MSKHTYADSTLKSWTKDELIRQIRILENNCAVRLERLNNQAKLLKAWAPVVHGHWTLERDPDDGNKPVCYHCSVCDSDGCHTSIRIAYKYCPNCGAKMDGGDTSV